MGKEIATRFRSFIEDELTQLEQRAESIKRLIKEHEHDIAELNMNLSTVKSAKSECETECKDIEEQIRRKKSEITGVDFIEEAVTSYSSGRKKRKETATPPITPMSTPNKKRAAVVAAEPVGTGGKNSNTKKRESEANSNTPVKTFSRDNLGRFGKKESSRDGAKNTANKDTNKDTNKDNQKNKNQTSKKDDTSDSTSESEDDISSSDEESDDSDDDYEDGNKAKRNKKNATEGKTSKSKGGRGKKK